MSAKPPRVRLRWTQKTPGGRPWLRVWIDGMPIHGLKHVTVRDEVSEGYVRLTLEILTNDVTTDEPESVDDDRLKQGEEDVPYRALLVAAHEVLSEVDIPFMCAHPSEEHCDRVRRNRLIALVSAIDAIQEARSEERRRASMR